METSILKQPCNDCPFRRNAVPGWTGAADPEWFVESALSDYTEYQGGSKFAPCHLTQDFEDPDWEDKIPEVHACVGALQFCANNMKSPRDPERSAAVRAAGTNPKVFANPAEFLAHHKKEYRC